MMPLASPKGRDLGAAATGLVLGAIASARPMGVVPLRAAVAADRVRGALKAS